MHVYKQYSIDENLREKNEAYCQTIHLGAIDNLDDYINPRVGKWYNKNNLTLDEIKIDPYQYLKNILIVRTAIKWDTFVVTP